MSAIVVAFAGAIGSGKTTLSKALTHSLGWPRVGFGDFVREVAASRGLSESRKSLQELGQSLLEEGITEFCQSVLDQTNWQPGHPLLIDGIRHVQVVEVLRGLVLPSKLKLVFVAVDDTNRLPRLEAQGLSDARRLAEVERHSTEEQVKTSLPGIADLQIQGSRPKEDLVAELIGWIREWERAG